MDNQTPNKESPPEKIDIKYFKMIRLPYVRPVANKVDWFFDKIGYVSRNTMLMREELLAMEYIKFIYNTIVGDRQRMMDKHVEGLQKIHDSVYMRMDQLKKENQQLKQEYDDFKAGMDGKEKKLRTEESRLMSTKDKIQKFDELQKQIIEKDKQIQELNQRLSETSPEQPLTEAYPRIVEAKGLSDGVKENLTRLGYQFLMNFPNLERVQTDYYVKVEGVEVADHAGLKALILEALKKSGYSAVSGVGTDADIIYRTSRGKKVAVEVLTADDLKEMDYAKDRVDSLKKLYKEIIGVTTEEDPNRFSQLGITVMPYFDFTKKI